MNKNFIIKKERQIYANTNKVWEILTETSTDWNGIVVETKCEWKPNSDITFSFVWDGKEYIDKGKIIQFENEKVFSYTYWSAFSGLPDLPENYSKIEFELSLADKKTILKLRHSDLATQTMYEHSDKNWEDTLDKIKEKCERQTTNR
jgi:hypothetical protein